MENTKNSGLSPMVKVAYTIMNHWDGVLRWFESQITNGILEARDLGLQGLDMAERLVQDKAVTGTQLALQSIQDLLLAGFEPSAGQSEYCLRGTPLNQAPGSWPGPIAHGCH